MKDNLYELIAVVLCVIGMLFLFSFGIPCIVYIKSIGIVKILQSILWIILAFAIAPLVCGLMYVLFMIVSTICLAPLVFIFKIIEWIYHRFYPDFEEIQEKERLELGEK